MLLISTSSTTKMESAIKKLKMTNTSEFEDNCLYSLESGFEVSSKHRNHSDSRVSTGHFLYAEEFEEFCAASSIIGDEEKNKEYLMWRMYRLRSELFQYIKNDIYYIGRRKQKRKYFGHRCLALNFQQPTIPNVIKILLLPFGVT